MAAAQTGGFLMRSFRRYAAASAAAILLVLAGPSPASAHDELVASSPAHSDRLTTPPEQVALTFSADVLQVGATIIVADSAERDWAVGEPAIMRDTVTVALADDMPESGYEIRWRVVSSDGHPISGVIPFTIGDGEPLVRTHERSAVADGSAVDEASGPVDIAESAQRSPQDQPMLRTVLIGAGGAIVAVAVLLLIQFSRRRTRGRANS